MEALGPADYVKMSDDQLTQIARRFGASFVVVPPRRRGHPGLEEEYQNSHYAVYRVPPLGRGGRGRRPRDANEPTRGDHGASRRQPRRAAVIAALAVFAGRAPA